MTFDQLQFFTILAETLNYTRTAELLFISQPTLSRQILLLEEELQTQLFVRTHKSLRLSPSGEIFLEEARGLLLRANQLRERMEQFKLGASGTLVCSTLGMLYPQFLELFRDFTRTHPDIRLMMMHHPTGNVKEAVLNGAADFGICYSFEIWNEPSIEVKPLFNENFRLLISDDHPFANRKHISITEIQSEHMILLGNDRFPFIHNLWERLQVANADRTAEINTPNSIQSVILNVQTGRYVSILPAPQTRAIEGCVSLEIEDFDSSFQTVMIWSRENKNPPLLLFLKYLWDYLSR